MPFPRHPRLLISRDEIPVIRARAEKLDWTKGAMEALVARNNERFAHPTTVPTTGGQWAHWYACKKHGTRLVTESDTRHVCPVDGEVFTGWPYDEVVVEQKHGALANEIREMGLAFALIGEKRCAERARDLLLAYADLYLKLPLHDKDNKPALRGGRITAQTLNESIMLIAMAQGADCIWETLSPADRETIATKLFRPAAAGIRAHKMQIHNIQCWKNSAVGLIGLLLEDAELVSDAIDSPHGLRAQLREGINADGMWYEGSWGYHFYTMSALMLLAEAAHHCGVNVYGPELRRMFEAPLVLAMPDGQLAAFNDSNPATARGNNDYEIALARYGDPQFAQPLATSQRDSLLALLNGVDKIPSATSQPATSHNFTASGFAILRNADTWLCLKYGPHGGWHGHYDKNSFVLYANRAIIAGDPGTALYGLPLHDEWYKTTLAHNTLTVDQTNQKEATGACLDFVTTDAWQAALIDAGKAIPKGQFQRAAFLLGPDFVVFIDRVRMSGGKDHRLDLALHLSGKWTGPLDGEVAEMPKEPGYEHLRDMRMTKAKTLQAGVDSPAGKVIVSVAPDPSGTETLFLRGTGVGRTVQDRVPIIIARRNGQETVYAWAISLGETPAQIEVESAAGEVIVARVKRGGESWRLTVDATQPAGRRVFAEH